MVEWPKELGELLADEVSKRVKVDSSTKLAAQIEAAVREVITHSRQEILDVQRRISSASDKKLGAIVDAMPPPSDMEPVVKQLRAIAKPLDLGPLLGELRAIAEPIDMTLLVEAVGEIAKRQDSKAMPRELRMLTGSIEAMVAAMNENTEQIVARLEAVELALLASKKVNYDSAGRVVSVEAFV